jgi:hypothetical protein
MLRALAYQVGRIRVKGERYEDQRKSAPDPGSTRRGLKAESGRIGLQENGDDRVQRWHMFSCSYPARRQRRY